MRLPRPSFCFSVSILRAPFSVRLARGPGVAQPLQVGTASPAMYFIVAGAGTKNKATSVIYPRRIPDGDACGKGKDRVYLCMCNVSRKAHVRNCTYTVNALYVWQQLGKDGSTLVVTGHSITSLDQKAIADECKDCVKIEDWIGCIRDPHLIACKVSQNLLYRHAQSRIAGCPLVSLPRPNFPTIYELLVVFAFPFSFFWRSH